MSQLPVTEKTMASEHNKKTPINTGLAFRIGLHYLVAPLCDVNAVLAPPSVITPVPKSQAWVLGVISINGAILPLIDLAHYFQGRPAAHSRRSRILVINHADIRCSVLVDEVFSLHDIPSTTTKASDDSSAVRPYLTASYVKNKQQWHVFNLRQLLQSPQFMTIAA